MIVFILHVLALLSSVRGLCYSPVLHGFAPDVILPTMLSSDIHCPPPHVFDHFHCKCVPHSVVKVREGSSSSTTTGLDLSLLNKQRISSLASPLIGLPDTHVPGSSPSFSSSWPAAAMSFQMRSSSSPSSSSRSSSSSSIAGSGRVVPVVNPYGAPFNLPVKGSLLEVRDDPGRTAAAIMGASLSASSKQREILEKVRWQEQLQRETVAVEMVAEMAAAAELASAARAVSAVARVAAVAAAASSAAVPVSSSTSGGGGDSTLDLFMRDTLRRILYGY